MGARSGSVLPPADITPRLYAGSIADTWFWFRMPLPRLRLLHFLYQQRAFFLFAAGCRTLNGGSAADAAYLRTACA